MSSVDKIQRILFNELDIRGAVCGLDKTCTDCFENHDYPEAIKAILGEMLVAVSLLGTQLKFAGRLILQAQGQGQVRYLMAETNHKNEVRAIAHYKGEIPADASWLDLVSSGQLALTFEPEAGKPYQGIVPLDGENLASCLMDYFSSSEQLPSKIQLVSDGQQAAGLFLQVLPAKGTGSEDWQRISCLAETLQTDELLNLDNESLLYRLFHEEQCRLYPANDIAFCCTCSRERSAASLQLMDKQELQSLLIELGAITVDCKFCNTAYSFNQQDIDALFYPVQ